MNPAQTAARLLGALAIQGRAGPLVAHLCRLASGRPAWWSAALGRKVEAVLAKRRESRAVLARRREALLAERERMAGIRSRLRAVAPAYAGAMGGRRPRPQLNAAV